jgi:hypothetical protein
MAKCEHDECTACQPNVVTKIAEDRELEWRAVRQQFPQNSGDNSRFRSWGNAVKFKSSVPEATREQERRELLSFCQQCWKFSNFRGNRDRVADMDFMEKAGVFSYRTINTTQHLRGKLTQYEFEKFVKTFIKTGKATGPDAFQNELLKTMSENELEVIREWANEVLEGRRLMSEKILNGTISQIHKNTETTNKTKD